MLFDLHLHSRYSIDALSKPQTIIKQCKKLGIGCALTDHNNMDAYRASLKLRQFAKKESVFLIPGEEIKILKESASKKAASSYAVFSKKSPSAAHSNKPKVAGEVVAYFLHKPVAPATFGEVLDNINSQGALLSCPHPFDWPRKNFKEFPKLWKVFDCMEIYNARAYYSGLNKKARKFSLRPEVNGKIACLGVSDAHTPEEIGNGLTEIDSADEEEFRKEIKKCRTKVIPHAKARLWHHFQTQLAKRDWAKAR